MFYQYLHTLAQQFDPVSAKSKTPKQLWDQYSQGIPTPIDGRKLPTIVRRALDNELEPYVIVQMLMESAYLKNLVQLQGPEQAQEFARLMVENA